MAEPRTLKRPLCALLAVLVFSLPLATHAQPSEADIAKYRVRLAEYVAKTDDVDAILVGMRGWYGWPFIARHDYNTGTVDFLVKAPAVGEEIRYLRTVGTVRIDAPHVLLAEQK